MNISPHHQRPTKYPWPGTASAAAVVLGLALVLLIGFMVISDSSTNDNEERDPSGMRVTAPQGLELPGRASC